MKNEQLFIQAICYILNSQILPKEPYSDLWNDYNDSSVSVYEDWSSHLF